VALHADEFSIDPDLVRSLLTQQFPQWADLPLIQLPTAGTVNLIFRLGEDKVVRLPRTQDFADGPQREAMCLPRFPGLPLRVPRYLALGEPMEGYPSYWSILDWIEGTTADSSSLPNLDDAASALAAFVLALRSISIEGAPKGGSYRAFGLGKVDRGFRAWAARLPDDIDRISVRRVWNQCLAVGEREGPPTWLHSDLRGDNLIARDGDLIAVIDWEGCTVGDPSADYLAAWWLFDANSRDTFRSALEADRSDWMRAKGWALLMAVSAIPYYADTNQAFVAQARTAITEILTDE
jgi:aminoglycoside phosphotransferase (APT) family kinase protein